MLKFCRFGGVGAGTFLCGVQDINYDNSRKFPDFDLVACPTNWADAAIGFFPKKERAKIK